MEVFYPQYYDQFTCLAGNCPDSCCKEWSVDVDNSAAAFYRQLPGALGDRLRQVLSDTEDGTIMTIENGRCPMWQQDGLCRIHAELGHDALCMTCREFPRISHDYGSFKEHGLELSCPEAARLILNHWDGTGLIQTVSDQPQEDCDAESIDILCRSRRAFLNFLQTTSLPFPRILTVLLLYAHDVQEELDGGMPAILEPEKMITEASGFAVSGDVHLLQNFFLQLEILTPRWRMRLNAPAVTPCWNDHHKALLRYFLCRYWLQAISDYDVLCRAKFSIAACLLIGYLGGDLVETAQLFSKEIENDPDNMEAILDGAYTAAALTDTQLLGLAKA